MRTMQWKHTKKIKYLGTALIKDRNVTPKPDEEL